jgi:hypothetical protein
MQQQLKYKFKYRRARSWFWRSTTVIGHNYDRESDKMVLYLEDGSIFEIAEWTLHECRLGTDWVLARKQQSSEVK